MKIAIFMPVNWPGRTEFQILLLLETVSNMKK